MSDPLNIGDDCDAFPAGEVLHSNLEVFDHRTSVHARKLAPKLVIETQAIVAAESLLDRSRNRETGAPNDRGR